MHERANRRNMILRHAGILSLLLVLGHSSAALAQSDEETGRSYAYGNLSIVDGDVWHQRADDFGAHEAERGSPFLPGDRIWTREPGQVELRFAGPGHRLDGPGNQAGLRGRRQPAPARVLDREPDRVDRR